MITISDYKKVTTLDEAYSLNQKKNNKIIGGMIWLKMSNSSIHTAIDLSNLELNTITETSDSFIIGCMTTLRDLELHSGLNQYTNGAIKEALCHIVGVQLRNMATIGGSLYGRYGFSDVLTLFLCMDTYVELYKGGLIPLTTYVTQKFDNDILVKIIVKKIPADYYYQSVRNSKTDFPVLTCATVKKENGLLSFSIGARPQRAILISELDYINEKVPTGSNHRASSIYRTHLADVLVKRGIERMGGTYANSTNIK